MYIMRYQVINIQSVIIQRGYKFVEYVMHNILLIINIKLNEWYMINEIYFLNI